MNRRAWLFLVGCLFAAVSCSTVAVDRFGKCGSYEQEMAQLWNEQTRRQLHDAVAQAGHPAPEKLTARIDKFAAMWVAVREESCDKTKIKDSRERAAYAACLDESRTDFSAYLELVARDQFGSAGSARQLLDLVLHDFAVCQYPQYYRLFFDDLAIKDRAKLEAAKAALARAEIMLFTRTSNEIQEAANERALQAAQEIGSRRLVAEAKLCYAALRSLQRQPEEARAYLDSAESIFQKQGDPYRLAEVAVIRAYVALIEGKEELAGQLLQENQDKLLASVGEKGFSVGLSCMMLGMKQIDRNNEEAASLMQKAVAIGRELREFDSHFLAESLTYLGAVYVKLDQNAEALASFEEALAIYREDPPDRRGEMDQLAEMIQDCREMINKQPPEESRP